MNLDSTFLKQQDVSNTIQIRVNISPKAGAYFGYEYRNRIIADNFTNSLNAVYYPSNAARGNCARLDSTLPVSQDNLPEGCTLNPADGSITYSLAGTFVPPDLTHIEENHAIFGLWTRPSQKLRFSIDGDIMTANNAFTRLSPLQSQELRVQGNYKATPWLNLNGNINLWYAQNQTPGINGRQHNDSFGFAVQIQPNEKFSVDLGYNYNDISSQLLVCFVATGSTTGTTRLSECFRGGAGAFTLYQQDKHWLHRLFLVSAKALDASRRGEYLQRRRV